jgi:hypothetical protein
VTAAWTTWLQQSRRHPSVLVLTLAGLLALAAAPALVLAGAGLVAQLVAGLAVPPLALALYLCLLPLDPSDEDDRGDGGTGVPGGGGPDRPSPAGGVDWERFERAFWAEVEHRRVRA